MFIDLNGMKRKKEKKKPKIFVPYSYQKLKTFIIHTQVIPVHHWLVLLQEISEYFFCFDHEATNLIVVLSGADGQSETAPLCSPVSSCLPEIMVCPRS